MLKVSKRNVLGLVVGVTLLGVAAPNTFAQDAGKGGKAGAAQPGHKENKEHKDKGEKNKDAATGAKVGEPAPAFELKDTDGKAVKLSDYKGKIVVIDWVNPECPVCRGRYEAGSMQNLVKKYQGKDVVFLGINSGAAGKPGSGAEANNKARKDWKVEFPFLLDESGKVGHTYGAKTTPHCFVIDKTGTLVYNGAIDNGTPNKVGDVNYVEKAVDQVLKGETVSTATTTPFGCAVKYGGGKS